MKAKELDFSVVIPVLNAENTIFTILKEISKYAAYYSIEVIIIDSGSTDKTSAIVDKCNFANLSIHYHTIKKTDFNHGKTRNLGVYLAKGRYIVFLTKFALPVNNFFKHFKEDLENIAHCVAVFGQQIPPKHSITFQDLELLCEFTELNSYTNKKGLFIQNSSLLTKKPISQDLYIWYLLSNSFSCYKREFLLKNPFPVTDYAEDIWIGKRILRLGLTKVYDKKAKVFYTHPYTFRQYYKRQKIDYFFKSRLIKKERVSFSLYKKFIMLFSLKLPISNKTLILIYFPIYYGAKLLIYIEYHLKLFFSRAS